MILLGEWPGRTVLSDGRFGILPSEIATDGDEPSPLLACVDPGDEDTEFVWVLLEPLPSSGTLTANDDGGMSLVGAVDGTYVVDFDLYTWAPGGPGVDEGTTNFTVIVGGSNALPVIVHHLRQQGIQ